MFFSIDEDLVAGTPRSGLNWSILGRPFSSGTGGVADRRFLNGNVALANGPLFRPKAAGQLLSGPILSGPIAATPCARQLSGDALQ